MYMRTQSLGGAIRVESAPGKGASFHVEMPLFGSERPGSRRGASK
jgi:signal transduction histidine kinase